MEEDGEKVEKWVQEVEEIGELNEEFLVNDMIKVRIHKLLEMYGDNYEECSFEGCNLPRDITAGLGKDTSCPYHRLLFDHWLYNVNKPPESILEMTKSEKRSKFRNWTKEAGKEECDRIVKRMSSDPLNWEC